MRKDHEIVAQVYAAQQDNIAADRFIVQYMPFIKAETASFLRRPPVEGRDDELSIAMFAFHEAVMAYRKERGSFLKFAARVIKNRLIDYRRKEQRHSGHISLDRQEEAEEGGKTLQEKLDVGRDAIAERTDRSAARSEIAMFAKELEDFGLSLADIADNCPKQGRTLEACHKALQYAKAHPELLKQMTASKKLPIAALVEGCGVERKTLERHRKYMMAILLAYTNGFEIIRGHLNQIVPVKGG